MSYALAFTGDAKTDFAELDVALQELVLDELDRLAESEASLPRTFTTDVIRDEADARHYVFIRVAVDRQRKEVVILGMHHHLRSTQ